VTSSSLASAEGFLGRVLRSGHASSESINRELDHSLGFAVSGARLTHTAGAAVRPPGWPRGAVCVRFSCAPARDRATTPWIVEAYARLASLCLLDRGELNGLLAGTLRDALTGCLNYAAVRHEVRREIHRCERHRRSLSCCFIDLDRFKEVNERYGHLHGSRVLANFAAILRAEVRDEDALGRYRGDEFVLRLPDTNEAAAAELAERVHSTIATTMINLPHDPINASIGVAQWQLGCCVDDTLEAADQALRAATATGGGTAIRASVLKAATGLESRPRQARASSTTDPP
jgi:diguanylate cyclase (GGDEF)-like protein